MNASVPPLGVWNTAAALSSSVYDLRSAAAHVPRRQEQRRVRFPTCGRPCPAASHRAFQNAPSQRKKRAVAPKPPALLTAKAAARSASLPMKPQTMFRRRGSPSAKLGPAVPPPLPLQPQTAAHPPSTRYSTPCGGLSAGEDRQENEEATSPRGCSEVTQNDYLRPHFWRAASALQATWSPCTF